MVKDKHIISEIDSFFSKKGEKNDKTCLNHSLFVKYAVH